MRRLAHSGVPPLPTPVARRLGSSSSPTTLAVPQLLLAGGSLRRRTRTEIGAPLYTFRVNAHTDDARTRLVRTQRQSSACSQ